MLDERFVENVLEKLFKEGCKEVGVIPQLVLVEVEDGTFKVLYFFRFGGHVKVIESRGSIDVFKSIALLQLYKRELFCKIQEQVEVIETTVSTTLCLN